MVKPRVERTRCSGTKTEAGMVSWVLSYMRKMTLRWKPRFDKMNDGRVKKPLGKNGKEVWANTCEHCKKWFKTSDLDMDHIMPIGGMRSLEDAGRWLTNALVETDGYQRLCHKCHLQKGKDVDNKEKSIRDMYPREESSYRNMMSRCNNPNATSYNNYGGRGIKVCPRWQESFFNFYGDMGPRPEYTSLDRIDYNGDYNKENCRWASQQEQMRNTSANNVLVYGDEVMCIQEWGEKLGIKANTLVYRIRRGWPIGEALELEKRTKVVYNGRLSAVEIIDIVNRINNGESQTSCGKLYEIDSSQVNRIYHKFKDHLYIFEEERVDK